MLDSHQHFWQIARGDYDWMGEHVAALRRDFHPDELRPLLARAGVRRTIVVQAAPTEAETLFLLELAEATEFIAGVVGWLDMDRDDFPLRLERLRAHPYFVGLRPMLQDLPDDAWILRPRVVAHLQLLAETGTPFDILALPQHLPHVAAAMRQVPGLRAVLDHLGKPDIASGRLDPWRGFVADLATLPNLACKVSGLVTEAAPDWQLDHLRPYVDHVATCFGADRLMFGSDWPVATLRASYADVIHAAHSLLGRHFGPTDMAKIFGHNAERFYGVAAHRG